MAAGSKNKNTQYCSAIFRKYANFSIKFCNINEEMNLLKYQVSEVSKQLYEQVQTSFLLNKTKF